MKLDNTAIMLLSMNDALQNRAYQAIKEICLEFGNEFGLSSSTCIDLDWGVVGVLSCNILCVYLKDDIVFVDAVDINSGERKDIALPVQQSIELLQILQDADISEEETFLRKYPMASDVRTDADLEKAWQLLADVPVDENDVLTDDFLYWEVGTDRQAIWDWFDQKHSKGVGYLNTLA